MTMVVFKIVLNLCEDVMALEQNMKCKVSSHYSF